MKEKLDWNAAWLDRTGWMLDHLESLDLKPAEALGLLLIERCDRFDMPVDHQMLMGKLGITVEQAEQLFNTLTERGLVQVTTVGGKVRFLTDGVLESNKRQAMSKSLIEEFEQTLARPLSSTDMKRIVDMESEYGELWVQIGLDEAVAYNKRNIDYVERLLASWKSRGLTTKDLQEGIRYERQ